MLLTICIPTYKRPITLCRCIDLAIEQIEKFGLSDCVNIHVANDASPDDTLVSLAKYALVSYVSVVTREQNLGMNVNIKCMLDDVAKQSDYQLIITDDDYLQPNILNEIVGFLRQQQGHSNRVPTIWTPRYSYTEDGEFHGVVCNPLEDSTLVKPSAINAGRYMVNGFVLSGLIVRGGCIDYEFWDKYKENAYFPVLFFGDLLFRNGAYYWNKNIVHHTVLNKCHWESWGRNDFLIDLRKFSDYMNAYDIMAKRISNYLRVTLFYYSSFPSLYHATTSFLFSNKLSGDKLETLSAFQELKAQGVLDFKFPLNLLMSYALLLGLTISILKLAVLSTSLLFVRGWKKEGHCRKKINIYMGLLRVTPIMFRLIWS